VFRGLAVWAVKSFLLTGSYWQLWYLNATVFAVLLLTAFFSAGVRLERVLLVGVVLYAVGLVPQTYAVFLDPLEDTAAWPAIDAFLRLIGTTRDGLFEGFLFVGIGAFLAWRPVNLRFKTAVVLLAASFALFFVEANAVARLGWAQKYDMYASLVPLSFLLFYVVARIEVPPGAAVANLRPLSSLVFYTHTLVLWFVQKAFAALALSNSLLLFAATAVGSVLVSQVIISLSGRKGLGWLKRMYS
jgi:hypothetical protein